MKTPLKSRLIAMLLEATAEEEPDGSADAPHEGGSFVDALNRAVERIYGEDAGDGE